MFDLELEKAAEEVKNASAKQVVLQLPDGLKTKAWEIVEYLERHTDAKVTIWLGSCFGACDLPLGLDAMGFDLMLQYGHNKYWKTIPGWSEGDKQ